MPPTDDPRSDQQLVEALNSGDTSAFDAIYYRYRDWVMQLAYRFTRSHEDSLDVLQETFAYLARKFPGFTLTASMTTFLYQVVRSTSLSILRKRRPIVSVDDSMLTAPPERSNSPELASVLSNLSEPAREVLLMRYVDGLALQEIASALQIPLGTVKSRIHNALTSLRHDGRTRRYFQP